MKREDVNDFSEMDDSFLQGLKKNPFSVPDNYFEELQQHTLSITKIIDFKTEASFKVEEKYFDNLESQILAQINIPENTNSFTVPVDYFDTLSDKIKEKVKTQLPEKQQTKIIKLSFIKYAAAAVILLATTFGVYNLNSKNTSEDTVISNKLAEIPNQEIVDYLSTYSDTNDIILTIENDDDDISLIEESIKHL